MGPFQFPRTDVVKVLEDGDLQTLGLLDYDRRLTHSFTAHPKVDAFTGEGLMLSPPNPLRPCRQLLLVIHENQPG